MKDAGPPSQESVKTRPARRGAPKLSKSLGPHLARLAKATGAMDPRLAAEWGEIAGPDIASLARPVRIVTRGKVQALEVSAKSSAAAMKLRYHQEALLGRVRQRIGLPRLTQIVIREGGNAPRWASRRMAVPAQDEDAPKRSPQAKNLKAALESMRRSMEKAKS